MLHQNLPRNYRIRSTIFHLFMNLNPNGIRLEYRLFKTKCKRTHPHNSMRTKDAQNGLDFHFKRLQKRCSIVHYGSNHGNYLKQIGACIALLIVLTF